MRSVPVALHPWFPVHPVYLIFQQSLSVMKQVKRSVLEECEHKGFENAMDRLFYKVREHVDETALENFMNCLELAVCEQEG